MNQYTCNYVYRYISKIEHIYIYIHTYIYNYNYGLWISRQIDGEMVKWIALSLREGASSCGWTAGALRLSNQTNQEEHHRIKHG